MIEQQSVVGQDAVATGGAAINEGRRRQSTRLGVASVLAILAFSTGCTADPAAPKLTTVADVVVGGISVHVALDDAGRVCSAVGDGSPVCQGTSGPLDVGIQEAQLSREAGAPFLMRVVVDPVTTLTGLPEQSIRVHIDAERDLVLAPTAGDVCFTYLRPDGVAGTATLHQPEIDDGSGDITAAAPAIGCE